MGLTYRISTLGCRVNHAETREIEALLLERGLDPALDPHDSPVDLEVIHTCSVTNTAAAKSRAAVRRAARRSSDPDAAVFVTGCYASTDPDEAGAAAAGDRVARVIVHHAEPEDVAEEYGVAGRRAGTPMIDRLAEQLDLWLSGRDRAPDRAAERDRHEPLRVPSADSSAEDGPDRGEDADGPRLIPLPVVDPGPVAARHVRAELRIQDGCDAHCTFCILPSIRPVLRSKPIRSVVAEARRLVDLGHLEIVLSGIFIGAYGHETALRRRQWRRHAEHLAEHPVEPLADLIAAVAEVPGLQRLRLSSMEPGDVTPVLLDAIVAGAPTVVPHLHLPLQSGSDAVLRRMNRQYSVSAYLEMIDMVGAALTDPLGLPPAITTDLICGFPGETDADFEQTVAAARRTGFLHMHVFPFSPRRGTAAARWTDQFVPHAVARERVRRLIDLENDPDDGLAIRFHRRLLGRTVRVVLEQPDSRASGEGRMRGRCDHYVPISVSTKAQRGTLVEVRVTDVDVGRALGKIETTPVSLSVL